MSFIWVLFAFVCGLLSKMATLPPLVGFLAAGFLLHYLGITPDENLSIIADIGIMLMLFTVGLKLNVKELLKKEVWGTAISHMGIWMLVSLSTVMTLASSGLAFLNGLGIEAAMLVAFSLSFSSTVCVVKLLEDSAELRTRHGAIAIGVLVLQDVAAVFFLVFATGEFPSPWALCLPLLFTIRPFLSWLLRWAGHGELLPLVGFLLAMGGYEVFKLTGVYGGLGALVAGMLLSAEPKATELTKSLLNFKDLFLIGFFFSIGFNVLPDWSMVFTALGFSLLLLVKFLLFFFILIALRVRARTAFLSSLALTNFSEFGLIVAAISVDSGWLGKEWLVILALALSFSFVITSIFYRYAHSFYLHYKRQIRYFDRKAIHTQPLAIKTHNVDVLVIGLGRVGKGVFRALQNAIDDRVLGMDADKSRVEHCNSEGMNIIFGDAEDADFWEAFDTSQVQLILIALPSLGEVKNIMEQLEDTGFIGKTAVIARFEDERKEIHDYGVDYAINFYSQSGVGLAREALLLIGEDN